MALTLETSDYKLIHAWWQGLEDRKGDRAALRRAISPEDILLQSAFHQFLSTSFQGMKLSESWQQPDNWYSAALLCGLLSKAKQDTGTKQVANGKSASFAKQLAMPAKGSSRPLMSETRFRRLQQSDSLDSFFLNMSRAIDLLKGKVNLESLTEDALRWCFEFETRANVAPKNRIALRWATDYFLNTPND